jgi:hypothetical protein
MSKEAISLLEASKLALEALKDNQHLVADNERHTYIMEYSGIIEQLEAALAQSQSDVKQSTKCVEQRSDSEQLGEPYAYEIQEGDSFTLVYSEAVHKYKTVPEDSIVATLYTTPQQRTAERKPLTEEQLIDLWPSLIMHQHTYAFARAIEAAHGITSDTDFKE